ncbi:hypothetical protein [Tepidiforma thermophila]|uniref:DUF5666 domain-containing protein n=1 Tax=Tepidiforma thermophila (strain KCTC 52669 / CGMCC 1.13589 / G233) TaxID=2761530 RepID=A0A2A9HIZ0_TEPT2|nr:hypothetical protein [Tepidiforma thermophila]PFG75373.1 hypothetical protein A9A59_2641 [Tepidiforma thermophila]
MTPDRLADLLQRALETGVIPPEADPAERAELEALLAARGELRAVREAVAREADAAMPAARARFQRHLAAHRPAPVEVRTVAARPSFVARLFAGRRLQFAGSLAALLLVAFVALLATRPFQGAREVQALGVDDYVQLSGVVTESAPDRVVITSPDLGPVTVAASGAAFLDASGVTLQAPPPPGAAVIVTGIVRDARKGRIAVDGQALAIAAVDLPAGNHRPLDRLRALPEMPEGMLALVAIGRDGRDGRAIVILPDGRRALVQVDAGSLEQVVAATGSPLGTRVRLADHDGGPFRLERLAGDDAHQGGPGAHRGLARIAGTIRAASPDGFTLETATGEVNVRLRPGFRILPGKSGLSVAEIRAGASLDGYSAAVAGGFDPRTGTFIATVVVLGPPP